MPGLFYWLIPAILISMIALFNVLIPFLISIDLMLIFIGIIAGIVLATQISSQTDPKKKRTFMIWTIVSFVGPIAILFIMVTAWGLINVFSRAVGI